MSDDKPKKATAKKAAAKQAAPRVDPQEGAYPRRNRTVDGQVVVEERRPGSKAWVRV